MFLENSFVSPSHKILVLWTRIFGGNFNIFLKIILISVQTAKVSKYVCVPHCCAVIGNFQRTINFSFKNVSKSENHGFRFFEKIRIKELGNPGYLKKA
jgi:hypothetical protein